MDVAGTMKPPNYEGAIACMLLKKLWDSRSDTKAVTARTAE